MHANTYSIRTIVSKDTIDISNKIDTQMFDYSHKLWGEAGVFVTFLVVITITMSGIWSPMVAIALMILAFGVMKWIGFFFMDWQFIAAFAVLGIITIIRINKK